ncbi:hypothetical protein ACS0TY_022360 [Phlomoides rotata]
MINEMGRWSGGEWEWVLSWKRRLNVRELHTVETLTQLLNSHVIQQNVRDSWMWTDARDGKFITKEAYHIIVGDETNSNGEDENRAFKMLWKCTAIRRYQATAWRILKQRIPTRDELKLRGIIPETQDIRCPLCGVEDESVLHIFLGCRFSKQIWYVIYSWIGLVMAPHGEPKLHLMQHSSILGNSKSEEYAVSLWVDVVGTIWKIRNLAVFEDAKPNLSKAIDEIKAKTWSWLKVK